jgi:hypothetical protein
VKAFLQKYSDRVTGVLSGFDRVLFRGTIRQLSAPQGMRSYLWAAGVLLKDFGEHVHQLSQRVKAAVVSAVEERGRPTVYLASGSERKEVKAREIAERDKIREGVVCLVSAVEPCSTFAVQPNRASKRLELRAAFRKCLFLYRYEIHPVFGFMHARIQTWFPFSVQIWINGREWLERALKERGVGYQREDNCYTWLEKPARAQALMDRQLRVRWPTVLDGVLNDLNPIRRTMFGSLRGGIYLSYYWSVAQSEWATDFMFRDADSLAPLYERFVRHAITTFGSPDVMRFLGRKVPAHGVRRSFMGEVVSDLRHRPEGICIKHRVNQNGIKLYDKRGSVLRVETTIHRARDISVYRAKEGDPKGKRAWRVLRNGVADLHRRCQVSQAANNRYADALAAVDRSDCVADLLKSVTNPTTLNGRRVRGLRPWSQDDMVILKAVAAGEFTITGMRNRDICRKLFPPALSPSDRRRNSARVSRLIRLLRAHRILAKIPHTHRYQLTSPGRRLITAIIAAHAASIEKLTRLAA